MATMEMVEMAQVQVMKAVVTVMVEAPKMKKRAMKCS